jgi:hypothetical protein
MINYNYCGLLNSEYYIITIEVIIEPAAAAAAAGDSSVTGLTTVQCRFRELHQLKLLYFIISTLTRLQHNSNSRMSF